MRAARRTFALRKGGQERRAPWFAPDAGIATLALLVLLLAGCGQNHSGPPVEDLSYASQVKFSDLHLSAEENFLGQQVVHLNGKAANSGTKAVSQLRVRLHFRDLMNQVVLREEHELFSAAQPLGPGQSREFDVSFDTVPASWNQSVPQVEIVSLRVQQP